MTLALGHRTAHDDGRIYNRKAQMMTRTFPRAAAALALAIAAQPAVALTPEEAWESLQALSFANAQTMTTTSVERVGDTLTVTGLATTSPLPEIGSIAYSVASIRFRDLGNDTVEITYPDGYDIAFTFNDGLDAPKSSRR